MSGERRFRTVTRPSPWAAGKLPKLLRSTYLADSESLLRETRATRLYYLPGPTLFMILFSFLTYSDAANSFRLPSVPFVTSAFGKVNGFVGGRPYLLYFLLILLIIGILWFTVRYLRWTSRVYAVTSHRVIVQSGIFGRDFDEIPIPQVRGVDVHQSVGQRMLGYGTIRVSAEGGGTQAIGNEDWRGIPRPFEFQRLIEGANEQITRSVGRASY